MKRDQRDSRISHTWRQAALTHELAVDLLPDVCVAFQAPPPPCAPSRANDVPGRADRRRAHRLDRGADAVRQLRRFGAGTCPCLNLGAYFHLGIFNEQFDFDGLHRVDRWTKSNIRAAQKNNIRAIRASSRVSLRDATQSRGRRDASTN